MTSRAFQYFLVPELILYALLCSTLRASEREHPAASSHPPLPFREEVGGDWEGQGSTSAGARKGRNGAEKFAIS
ncbi:MAG: hypothetical protein K2Y18_06845 [Alphaproteobacteria bacterium]|jgi:hypothetical protein|nr:hypothetical protein [Alphaproteobacteria bacterium]